MATRMWDDETEGDVWYVGVESSSKDSSHAVFTDSSDTDSTVDTMETIQTDDLEDYFRVEHGRVFPGFTELPMALPSDAAEIHRLRIQHRALHLVVGDTVESLMARFLTPCPDGRRRTILDVRTQSGIWAEETATRFPHVDVKTIDVAPTIPHIPHSNLFHEVYDTHAGILEPEGSFDLVHARNSVNMMRDWRKMLKEIHRVLRPGGLLIFAELEPRLSAPGVRESALDGPASRSASFFDTYRDALSKGGVLSESYQQIDNWLNPSDPLWASSPGSGFRDVSHEAWDVPINGLWHPDPVMQEIGMLMAMNFCKFLDNARPLFLSSGIPEHEYERWANDARREVRDPANDTVIRYHIVCAYKL